MSGFSNWVIWDRRFPWRAYMDDLIIGKGRVPFLII